VCSYFPRIKLCDSTSLCFARCLGLLVCIMLMGRHPFITEDEQRVLDAGNTLLPMPILSRIVSGEGDAMRRCTKRLLKDCRHARPAGPVAFHPRQRRFRQAVSAHGCGKCVFSRPACLYTQSFLRQTPRQGLARIYCLLILFASLGRGIRCSKPSRSDRRSNARRPAISRAVQYRWPLVFE
jgi:hypothetical protein